MKTLIHNASNKVSDPQEALRYLKEGNKRFVEGVMIHRKNSDAEWDSMQKGQYPFAAILSCSDSRVSPSVIFDQKNGDIFTVSNAGNVVDPVSLGSLEYAAKYLEVPLIVVCGHSDCGAVKATFTKMEDLPENLSQGLQSISDSIEGESDITQAEMTHVQRMAEKVRSNKAVQEAGTVVVEAYYDISDGVVSWLED